MTSHQRFSLFLFFLFIFNSLYFSNLAYSQIQNGSFESGTNPGSYLTVTSPNNTTITGWNVVSADIDYIGSYWQAANGTRSIDLSGSVGSAGAIQQTFTTTAGATYYITFSLAGNPDGPQGIKTVQVSASPCSGCLPLNYNFDTTGHSTTNMGWVDQTYIFTATSTSTTITFTSLTNSGYGPAIDNVRESHTLPPPAPVSTGANTNVIILITLIAMSVGSFLIRKTRLI
jgi:choice-of-anchor C domain-containing protein